MVLSAVHTDWDATGSVQRDAMARKRELLGIKSRDFINYYKGYGIKPDKK